MAVKNKSGANVMWPSAYAACREMNGASSQNLSSILKVEQQFN